MILFSREQLILISYTLQKWFDLAKNYVPIFTILKSGKFSCILPHAVHFHQQQRKKRYQTQTHPAKSSSMEIIIILLLLSLSADIMRRYLLPNTASQWQPVLIKVSDGLSHFLIWIVFLNKENRGRRLVDFLRYNRPVGCLTYLQNVDSSTAYLDDWYSWSTPWLNLKHD